MKKAAIAVLTLALLWSLSAPFAVAAESKTLTGRWVWEGSDSGDLEAVFTPTGQKTWNVAFHFTFQGRHHTYEGTAEGTLADGDLYGTVRNESKSRTYRFQGSFQAGEFRGTHAEIDGGRETPTGSLTLKG